MRPLLLAFFLAACSGEEDAPIEPFDLQCGDLVCEGSTEACWPPDCGTDDDTYSCEPLPDACLEDGADDDCHGNGACDGTRETGFECGYSCG